MKPQDFKDKSPRFIPEEYFSGQSAGEGMFFDRFNNLRVNFKIELNGNWDGKILTLNEFLKYENGEETRRSYKIKKIDENHYEAEMPDLVGTAKLESYGNVLRWKYRLKQKIGSGIWTLKFDDWMYLKEDGLLLNRAYASKFGFAVGEVFLAINKK